MSQASIYEKGESKRQIARDRYEPKGDGLCLCYSETSFFFCQSKTRYSHRFHLCLTLSLCFYLQLLLWSDLVAVTNNTKTHRRSHTLWYSHTLSVSITCLFNLCHHHQFFWTRIFCPHWGKKGWDLQLYEPFLRLGCVRQKLCRIQSHLRRRRWDK